MSRNCNCQNILAIDPSGTGTTGIFFFRNNNEFLFTQFKNKDWEEHLLFVLKKIEEYKPKIIIYENSNYVHRRVAGSLNLFKLIGAIVSLKFFFPFVEKMSSMAVNQVKIYKQKIWKNEEQITDLTHEIGRSKGWKYRGIRINLHQLDALIICHLWQRDSLDNICNIKSRIEELEKKKKLGKKQAEQLSQLRQKLSQ